MKPFKLSMDVEVIQEDNKLTKAVVVAAINNKTSKFDAEAINAARVQKGQAPSQPQKKKNGFHQSKKNDTKPKRCHVTATSLGTCRRNATKENLPDLR
jgi:hypothetical protein